MQLGKASMAKRYSVSIDLNLAQYANIELSKYGNTQVICSTGMCFNYLKSDNQFFFIILYKIVCYGITHHFVLENF